MLDHSARFNLIEYKKLAAHGSQLNIYSAGTTACLGSAKIRSKIYVKTNV